MKAGLRVVLAMAATAVATQAAAQLTFYEGEAFSGRSFTARKQIDNLQMYGFNDRASSIIVERDRWEVCEDSRFNGRCMILRAGRYPSLAAMGLNDRVSSVRSVSRNTQVEDHRYGPSAVYDARRRGSERLYEADVTSVRAVVGPSEQRCWVEREEVGADRREANVPAAIAGAVIGGILGHQVGGGRGKDLATAGGAVAGAALGSQYGRDAGNSTQTRDVQRCSTHSSEARPSYWDVSYAFRGQEHRVQMSAPPGRTVTVNGKGEPRA
jgi:uncharacterized protein YcfJ